MSHFRDPSRNETRVRRENAHKYRPMSPELTVSVEDQVCQLLTPQDHILTPREYPLKDNYGRYAKLLIHLELTYYIPLCWSILFILLLILFSIYRHLCSPVKEFQNTSKLHKFSRYTRL